MRPIVLLFSVVFVFALAGCNKRRTQAQIATARLEAVQLEVSADTWRVQHPEAPCPTLAQLQSDKTVDRSVTGRDPWGHAYVMSCTDEGTTVVSFGPDGKSGTADDIRSK
jgi:hypothetical protein